MIAACRAVGGLLDAAGDVAEQLIDALHLRGGQFGGPRAASWLTTFRLATSGLMSRSICDELPSGAQARAPNTIAPTCTTAITVTASAMTPRKTARRPVVHTRGLLPWRA